MRLFDRIVIIQNIVMIKKIHACNRINFSSNIVEVIRTVLNFLFFLMIRFHNHKKAQKSTESFKAQLSKSVKRK